MVGCKFEDVNIYELIYMGPAQQLSAAAVVTLGNTGDQCAVCGSGEMTSLH